VLAWVGVAALAPVVRMEAASGPFPAQDVQHAAEPVAGGAAAEPAQAEHPAQEEAAAQGESAQAQAEHPEHEEAAGHGEGEAHEGESIWRTIARLLNFAILVGGLGYLLKTPVASYLKRRSEQISRDLVEAEQLRVTAGEQITQIDERLRALPDELELLKVRGADEVAAEEARIRQAAEAARERLLEQTRREIDQRVRVARQELMREAADLAVGVASERIREQLTPEGHVRLVDRYADQVRHAGSGRE
jgi:F-type H+-transporting ATPase subunit b